MSEYKSTIVTNKKARFNYHILESVEAGIELRGTEVKSLRMHKASLNESYARIENGQMFLFNFHIAPYEFGNINNHVPLRTKRLLLHRREIKRLLAHSAEQGLSLIPIKLYFKKGWAKIEIGLARGKKLYDKRHDLKNREDRRAITRAIRDKRNAD
jgi:SsrA-binding protein